MTNKTPQEAVRGFGQAPTNFALERAMDCVARFLDVGNVISVFFVARAHIFAYNF